MDINAARVAEGTDGQSKLQFVAEWRDKPMFSAAERVALEYAERMTITGQRVDEHLFARLKAHFTEAQIVGILKELDAGTTATDLGPRRVHANSIRLWRNRYGG